MKALIPISLSLLAACGGTPTTGTQGAVKEAGARPGSYYYTADEGGGNISKIDAATNTFVKKIKAGGSVHNVQVSPDGNTLGATVIPKVEGHDHGHAEEAEGYDYGHAEEEAGGYDHDHTQTKGSAYFYDTATDELVRRIEVGEHPAHIVFTQDGRYALVTNTEDDNVTVIDAKAYEVFGTIPTGKGPHGFRIAEDGRFAYVANMGEDTVSVLDLGELKEAEKIKVGKTPVMTGITSDGKALFVTLNAEDALAVVDLASGAVEKVPVGVGPVQVYVQPNDEYAYVANQGTEQNPSHTLSKIDVSSRKVVATVETGEGTHGVVTSEDSGYVYVTNTFENTVSVIDNQRNAVAATVPVGERPNGISYKP